MNETKQIMKKPTVAEVAGMFVARPGEVRSQYRKNAIQLRGIAAQAGAGRSRGATGAKWLGLAQSADDAASGIAELRSKIEESGDPKSVLWRMRGPDGEFVGINGRLAPAFVDERSALVFDGRDNEATKLAFFRITLGNLHIEVL